MRYGPITVVCAFTLGVGFRSVFDISVVVILWLVLIGFGLSLLWRLKRKAISAPLILISSLCFLATALGVFRTEVASWQFNVSTLEAELGQSVRITGLISTEPDYREKSVHLYIKTGEDIVFVTTDRLSSINYGDKVTVSGKLERPESFVTDLGRTFDYPKYLQAKGVEYRISFAEVSVIESNQGNLLIATLLKAKKEFIESIGLVIPEPSVGLGVGLLLGVKSSLGEDIENNFRKTGIIHIVVLSGYNVMLVVAFIMFAFSFLLPLRIRIVAGIISIICFALIVGLSATVVRASIMATLVLLAQSMGRNYDVIRGLFLAGLVMLLINPYLLVYDIGFQLSFMATLGLILIVPQFESVMAKGKGLFGARDFFLATCATQVAVLPLLIYHIGEVSLIALVVNVLVLPMVPIAMLLTFITGIVGFLSFELASIVGYGSMLSLNYILLVANWFASLPFAAVTVPEFSFAGVVGLYAMMIFIYLYFNQKNREADDMKGWIIVEEKEKVGSESEPTKSDIPVFFR